MPKLPKLTILLFFYNILKKFSDEVEILHADKHESFLQVDAVIFDGDGQVFPSFPKQQVCNVFTIS